jgi:WD40 repeat protein
MKKLFLLIILAAAAFNYGYSFGKNKINYYDSDWKIIETPHFQIYMSSALTALSNRIVFTAEEIFSNYCIVLQYNPVNKIRIVMYDNQIDFQQNNISESWIGEGTGGFTEFIKGRVVIPYSGNFSLFRHILAHELCHAFQAMIWGEGVISMYLIRDIQVPLWMIEGAAEYVSIGVDPECEMMVSEGILNGTLPSLKDLSEEWRLEQNQYYFIYKEGQIFYQFAVEKYGKEVIPLVMHAIGVYKDLQGIMTNVFKTDMDTLNAEFMDYLRKKYYPAVTNLTPAQIAGSKLMPFNSYFNMNPVYIDSNRIAFISDRMIYPSIVIYNKKTGSLERIIKGGFDEDYLEFHYGARNNLSISTNGKLCFISRSGGKDVIHIYDMSAKKVTTLDLPMRIINSPEISMDGSKIVFSASKIDHFDIYIYTLADGTLNRLFDDIYYDTQPRWIDGNTIVFVSDRADKNGTDLFIYSIAEGKFLKSIDTGYADNYPSVSPDGTQIAFIMNTIHPTLMIYCITNDRIYEQFIPDGGVFSPAWGKNGTNSSLVYTYYQDSTFNIYEYKPVLKAPSGFRPDTGPFTFKALPDFQVGLPVSNKNYGLELSIDSLFGLITFNSAAGAAILGVMNVSDLLGNHRMQILMDMLLSLNTNVLEHINFDVSYYFLKYRSDFGIRVYLYSNYFYEFSSFQSFFEMEKRYRQTWGFSFLYQYPFDTFNRFEASFSEKDFAFIDSITVVGSNYVYNLSYQHRDLLRIAYVHDSTLWDYTGPVDGIRCDVSFTKGFKIFPTSISFERFLADLRMYLLITPGYSLAFRGVAGLNMGYDKDAYPFYIGGFNSIRGYDNWSFSGDTMFLLNFEFRFPLLINVVIGLPFPIPLPIIWGTFFVDIGSAWNLGSSYEVYEYKGYDLYLKDLKIGLGFGLRMVLIPGIKLMVDFAVPYDGFFIPPLAEWVTVWQIGVDF